MDESAYRRRVLKLAEEGDAARVVERLDAVGMDDDVAMRRMRVHEA